MNCIFDLASNFSIYFWTIQVHHYICATKEQYNSDWLQDWILLLSGEES